MICPVQIRDLSFKYSDKSEKHLKGISLDINKGEILIFTGANGSGKTTLCYCICGIIPLIKGGIFEGEVKIMGRSVKDGRISELSSFIGMVFQNPDIQLFLPTVEDEIAFGPENFAVPQNEIRNRIDSVLNRLGIEKLRYRHPRELSGGEKHLVALASVLSIDPDILIFDEITSQLDAKGRIMVGSVLQELREENKTIIMVEHNRDYYDMADRIKTLREGCLHDYDHPEEGREGASHC